MVRCPSASTGCALGAVGFCRFSDGTQWPYRSAKKQGFRCPTDRGAPSLPFVERASVLQLIALGKHAASKCEIASTAATGELDSTAADGLEQHCAARGQPWDECGARATPECSRRRHRCCCWLLRLWPPAREAACARAVDARLDHQLRSRRRNSFQE